MTQKTKKRYWLKLDKNYFNQEYMLYLESVENGYKYAFIWIKILLLCLKDSEDNAGFLRFNDKIPFTETLLSKVLRIDIDTIRVAMKYFIDLQMIEIMEDGTYYIEEVQKLIGSESTSAERVRLHRERKKLLLTDSNNVTDQDVTLKHNKEVEVDIEVDIDIEPRVEKKSIKQEKPEYIGLATLLYQKHKEYDENFLSGKNIESTMNRWAKDIRLLIETDNRPYELVQKVIIWCQEWPGRNNFSWRFNILSGSTLRRQFDKLLGGYNADKPNTTKPKQPQSRGMEQLKEMGLI